MGLFNFRRTNAYLRDFIAHLPKRGRGEISRIAKHLKVSTTLISQVLNGEKSFTLEQAEELTKYLGLHRLEADYFILMVQLERSGTPSLRKYFESKLEEIRQESLKLSNRIEIDRKLSDQDRSIFYSSAIYSAIRLYASTNPKGKTLEEICQRFDLSRSTASEILKFLTYSGLCIEESSRFLVGPQKTHLERGSPYLLRHHTNWRLRAISQIENLSEEELMFTSPVSLSKKDFELLREEMVGFIKKALSKIHDSAAEEIACFNLDFFWIKK